MTNVIVDTEVVSDYQLLYKNSSEIEISSQQKLNTTSNEYDNPNLYINYHQSEIEQNEKMHKLARIIILIGFLVTIIGIILCFLGLLIPSIITTSVGIITEAISCTIMILIDQSDKRKKEYYKQLSFDREFDIYINIVRNISLDNDKKAEILNKLIDNYCQRRK